MKWTHGIVFKFITLYVLNEGLVNEGWNKMVEEEGNPEVGKTGTYLPTSATVGGEALTHSRTSRCFSCTRCFVTPTTTSHQSTPSFIQRSRFCMSTDVSPIILTCLRQSPPHLILKNTPGVSYICHFLTLSLPPSTHAGRSFFHGPYS